MTSTQLIYVMVGYLPPSSPNLNGSAVYWLVDNTPDYTGALSPFPGQLINIAVSYSNVISGPPPPSGVFTAGQDLSGTQSAQTVIGLQDRPIAATAPSTGQSLVWNGVNWTPVTISTPSSLTMSGDVTGTTSSSTVIKLQNHPVSSASISNDGFALTSVGGVWTPVGTSPVFNVKNYGAVGDGTTPDSAAFNAAIAAIEANTPAGGGVLHIPTGVYHLTSAVDVGTVPLIVQGTGWGFTSVSVPGSVYISDLATYATGSILLCDGSGLTKTTSTTSFCVFRDFLLIGPGHTVSTAIGLTLEGTGDQVRNVGATEFGTGILLQNEEDVVMDHPVVILDGYGIHIVNVVSPVTEVNINDIYADGNQEGVRIEAGAHFKLNGGLIQSNYVYGIHLVGPAVGSLEDTIIHGIWYENNITAALALDLTSGSINKVDIDGCRFTGVTGIDFIAGTGDVFNLFIGRDNRYNCSNPLVIPATVLSGYSEFLEPYQNIINHSTQFDLRPSPTDITSIRDYTSTTDGYEVANAVGLPLFPNGTAMFLIDVIATNGTDQAVWLNHYAAVAADSDGYFVALYGVDAIGSIPPTANTAGAAAWRIQVVSAGSVPHNTDVQVLGSTPSTKWRIRIRGFQISP